MFREAVKPEGLETAFYCIPHAMVLSCLGLSYLTLSYHRSLQERLESLIPVATFQLASILGLC